MNTRRNVGQNIAAMLANNKMSPLNQKLDVLKDLSTSDLMYLVKKNLKFFTFDELEELEMLIWSESLERDPENE